MIQKYAAGCALTCLALSYFTGDLSVHAAGLNQTYACDYPMLATDWQTDGTATDRPLCEFPKYDINQGALQNLRIEFSVNFETQIKVENLDSSEQLFNLEITTQGELTAEGIPASQLQINLSQPFGYTDSLPSSDGFLDYGGNSGKTFSAPTQPERDSRTVTDPAILSQFSNAGGQDLNRLQIKAKSKASLNGSGNLASVTETRASMNVRVTYNFDPSAGPSLAQPQSSTTPGSSIGNTGSGSGSLTNSAATSGNTVNLNTTPRTGGFDGWRVGIMQIGLLFGSLKVVKDLIPASPKKQDG